MLLKSESNKIVEKCMLDIRLGQKEELFTRIRSDLLLFHIILLISEIKMNIKN
jgi:hypothetical protein